MGGGMGGEERGGKKTGVTNAGMIHQGGFW